jgi:hypothetical protein
MYSSSNPCPPLKWKTCKNRNQQQKKMVQCMKPKKKTQRNFFPHLARMPVRFLVKKEKETVDAMNDEDVWCQETFRPDFAIDIGL